MYKHPFKTTKEYNPMNEFWEKVEQYNGKLIPFALVLLFVIIIFELFIHIENLTFQTALEIADYIVIAIFAIDLTFLSLKAKSAKLFFKKNWLDLLAIIPFAILFRAAEEAFLLFRASEQIAVGQAVLHETIEVSKATKIERLAAVERFTKIGRGIKIIARSLRLGSKTSSVIRFQRKKISHKKDMQTKNKNHNSKTQII